jgi:hypothetical protein
MMILETILSVGEMILNRFKLLNHCYAYWYYALLSIHIIKYSYVYDFGINYDDPR